jgi:UDP-N-acetylmuramoyl-tripeptide--D-alanyl-D-alanine ligase
MAFGEPSLLVTGVSTDSRTLRGGELFVSLRGPRFDGNAFAAGALEAGAVACLVERGRSPAPRPGRASLEVDDPSRALRDLAGWYRARFTLPLVGVTGSCGKTTTKDYLAHLLSRRGRVAASEKSFNNAVGVPLTCFRIERGTRFAVLEVGTSARGEIGALAEIARPTAGIVTCVTESHLAGLRSIDGVAREKGDLLEILPPDGFAVLNVDCPRTAALADRTRARVRTVATVGPADFTASEIVAHAAGTAFLLNGEIPVTFPALGTHNVQNALLAIAAAVELGLEISEVALGIETLPAAPARLERKRFGDLEVLDDTYNANPASTQAAIRVLAGIRGAVRKVFVFGDMRELGERSAALHEEVGRAAAAGGVDLFATVGSEAARAAEAAIAEGRLRGRVVRFADAGEAGAALGDLLRPGDLVLVKGSRAVGLERVVDGLRSRFATAGNGRTKSGGPR